MLESIKNYWYYWLLLLGGIVVTVIIWKNAVKAVSRRSKRFNAEVKMITRMKELYEKYEILTAEKLNGVGDEETFEAVVANILLKIKNASGTDLEKFDTLNMPQKYMCAVWYLREDTKGGKIQVFFRENGDELTSLISAAFSEMGERKLASLLQRGFDMFDPNCETASCDDKSIGNLNMEYNALIHDVNINNAAARYIRQNLFYFIDEG